MSVSDPRRPHTGETDRESADSAKCRVDIRIDSQGPVNIYNCSAAPPCPEASPPCPPKCPTGPIAPGQCVPLAIGAKPKQSLRTKLDALLQNTPVPSAIASGFFQHARRFAAGQSPANPLETEVFGFFEALPPDMRSILSCSIGSFDGITPGERNQLFDPSIPQDPNVPLDAGTLATAFVKEITERVGVQVFDDPGALGQERPGQNRFFDTSGSESFDIQLRICRLNDLRTNEFAPPLSAGDYLPTELQQHCEAVVVDGVPKLSCEVEQGNCPGNFLSDTTCLRVPDVNAGDGIVLEGVNFISIDSTVRLTGQAPSTVSARSGRVRIRRPRHAADGGSRWPDRHDPGLPGARPDHVRRSARSPARHLLGSGRGTQRQWLPRLRRHHRLEFAVHPGRAATHLPVPHRERDPYGPRGDLAGVVRLRRSSRSRARVPDHRQPDGPDAGRRAGLRLTGVRGHGLGDLRQMAAVLFDQQGPMDGLVMTVMGYEIDSEQAYRDQINSFTDAFMHYLKIALAGIAAGITAGAVAVGIKTLLTTALAHPIIAAIAAAVVLVVILILAAWAPADLIIEDSLAFTLSDLDALTSAELPIPPVTQFISQQGIKVTINPLEKIPTQYKERREYRSDEEDSRYEIVLRYNRVA